MLISLMRTIIGWLLTLRYRLTVSGIEAVAAKGKKGILFLPNHPALIDPIILSAYLEASFAPRTIADKDHVDKLLLRWLVRRTGAYTIPRVTDYGSAVRCEVEKVLDECIEDLKRGDFEKKTLILNGFATEYP